MSALEDRLFESLRMKPAEQARLRRSISRRYVSAYRAAITNELRRAGLFESARGPSGPQQGEIDNMIRRDVESIVNTYHDALRRKISEIAQTSSGPDEARQALRKWNAQRSATRERMIVNASRQNATTYAQKEFFRNNPALQGDRFIWDASPPLVFNSHQECEARVRGGPVSWDIAQNWQSVHPNCRHVVARVGRRTRLNARSAWRG